MADSKVSALTNYTNPVGADYVPIIDSSGPASKRMTLDTMNFVYASSSSAAQGPGFAADTYLTGSTIAFPTGAPTVGATYRLLFDVTKTAVGTATPIVTLRLGTAGTTSDTARCTFTFGAGTAVASTGIFQLTATFRTVGSSTSAVLVGLCTLDSLPTTGVSSTIKAVSVVSSGFDSTVSSLKIGASYNGGTSAVHTVQLVRAELML